MGDAFPELKHHEVKIRNTIAEEEPSFGRTLLKGIGSLRRLLKIFREKHLSGELMAEERGLLVDVKGLENAMEEARNKSRSAQNKQVGGVIVMDVDATSELHKRGVSPTDDNYKFIWPKDHESVIKVIYNGAEYMNSTNVGDEVGIIMETTSFYGEQGGQIFDTGSIMCSSGSFQVCNVHFFGGFVIHIGSFAGETGKISVDYDGRA